MASVAKQLVITAVLALAGFAQTPTDTSVEKVFRFTVTDSPRGVQEVINTLRSIAEVPQADMNTTTGMLTVRGSANQMALVGWLFPELDRNAPASPPPAGTLEYKMAGTDNSLTRVYYLTHTPTPQSMQEIINGIRSVFELQRVVGVTGIHAIVARGTQDQVNGANWMIEALDRTPGTQTAPILSYTFEDPARPNPRYQPSRAVRIFYLNPTDTPQSIQELVNAVRSLTELQRVVAYNPQKAMVARGTADQVAMAEWLLNALEKPSAAASTGSYPYPDTSEVTRVFFVKGVSQELLNEVRSTAKILRAVLLTAPSALAVRGSVGQVAMAEQILSEKAPK